MKNAFTNFNKKAEFQALLDLHKPDFVIGMELWLTPEHYNREFFPSTLGYTPSRENRVTDTKRNGVFILIRTHCMQQNKSSLRQIVR